MGKRLVFGYKVLKYLFLFIGFYCFSILVKNMEPIWQEAATRNAGVQKIHTTEFSNKSLNYQNYDGIKFIIVNPKVINGNIYQSYIEVDTSGFKIPTDKLRTDIVNRSKALGRIMCEAVPTKDYNDPDKKKKLITEKYDGIELDMLPLYSSRPSKSYNDGYIGYFYPIGESGESDIFYNQTSKLQLIELDPSLTIIRISIIYDTSLIIDNLAKQTYNYITIR